MPRQSSFTPISFISPTDGNTSFTFNVLPGTGEYLNPHETPRSREILFNDSFSLPEWARLDIIPHSILLLYPRRSHPLSLIHPLPLDRFKIIYLSYLLPRRRSSPARPGARWCCPTWETRTVASTAAVPPTSPPPSSPSMSSTVGLAAVSTRWWPW